MSNELIARLENIEASLETRAPWSEIALSEAIRHVDRNTDVMEDSQASADEPDKSANLPGRYDGAALAQLRNLLPSIIATLSAQPSGLREALTAARDAFRTYARSAEGHYASKHELANDLRIQADLCEVALSRPASVEGGEPVAAPFGLSSDDVEALRSNGLKPEEIAGDPTAQAKRVRELLHWFSRLSRKSANPKWTTEHAFELAYYIATTDDRAAFDISAVEREAWKKGLQEPAEVRDMAVRHGWIPSPVPASGTPALAHPAKPAVQDGIECHGLDTPERVCFYEQDFYVLSNFSAFNVTWAERRKFQTAEHCYHWLKFATLKGSPGNWTLSDESAAIAKSIAEAPSAHEAFKIAERNRRLRRPDWDDVKVEFMRKIIRAKAAQHEYVRRKLLATGDRELVENSWRDDFWGWGPNRDGKNMLGKLWMEVRAEIRAASPAPQEPDSEVKP